MINNKKMRSYTNEEILSFMAQKFQEMKETYQEETTSLRDQISIVEQSLAERRVLIDKLSGMQSDQGALSRRLEFPIYTEEDLANLNDEINDTNRDTYIKTMETLMQPNGINRNLKKVLAPSLIMDFNLDGILGKKSLKNYTNFYNALLKSIPVTNLSGPAETQLRDAIKLVKKRNFQSVYYEEKKNNKLNKIESIDDGSSSNSLNFA
ncbi:uncharacterized protein [Eurosta solidaginis]|uniref:uncharacterized protein isoform X2 n=1 Tax=Eurosta solidaginis TaxID=178769 RepID=UPI003530A245